jgi:hypothetical protein
MALKQFSQSVDSARIPEFLKKLFSAVATLAGRKYAADATDGNVTLTAAQLLGGFILRSAGATSTDVFPTATAIINAMPDCEVGDAFTFEIINTKSGTITMAIGTGITLAGTTTIATGTSRRYLAIVTNVGTPAVTIRGL